METADDQASTPGCKPKQKEGRGHMKPFSTLRTMVFVVAGVVMLPALLTCAEEPPGKAVTLTLPSGVKLELVRIPRGVFRMGSPEKERGRCSDEGPAHFVTIGYEFYLGKYQVTQAQWVSVMGRNPTRRYGIGDNYPVYYVSWDDCQQFISRLNQQGLPGTFRLPSEAEWEYACRAGTQTRYFFGDSIACGDVCEDGEAGILAGNRSDYMWYCGNHGPAGTPDYAVKPVGQRRPNGFGLYDMSGNLWEWCLDAYHPNYEGAPTDGSAWQGPLGSSRVLRGGAWDYHAKHCRSASRNGYVASRGYTFHGLRVVWFPYSRESDEWYASWEAAAIADNIVSYQNEYGSWPKNMNMAAHGYQGEKFTKNWGTSIDNGATIKELRFLARVIHATGKDRYKPSFNRGLDYLFQAQYDNGGWPQRYPPGNDYGDYITFNDNAVVNAMLLMDDIVRDPGYSFVDTTRRKMAKESYRKGLQCIMDCQVVVDGRRTVWGAQHDQKTLEPRAARAFEPNGLCGGESSDIVLFLMSLENPSETVIEAIEGAVDWFEENKITGMRQVVEGGTKVLKEDPEAPPMWARFYEFGTGRPIFAGMDGVVKYNLNEIEKERIMGYRWYVYNPVKALEEYAKWKKALKK